MIALALSTLFAVTTTGATTSAAVGSTSKGSVDVLYAGSLEDTMAVVGPAFEKATGYTFDGFPNGSSALASEIRGKTQKADVFISAGSAASASLEGTKNSDWVSWYAQFGTTPLLLGYNPKSKFAHDLKTEPWYKVVSMPGFHIGRTDPATDPKGVLAVTALNDAAKTYHEPVMKTLATETSDVFTEDSLVGRLQAGQLDAGFFYGLEATAANITTVTLGTIKLVNAYTITVVNRAPHPAGAAAYVAYLLRSGAAAILRKEGLSLTSPASLSGAKSAVPASLKSLVS